MIYELRKEVLAWNLQGIFFENDYHYHFVFENLSQYLTDTQKNLLKRGSKNRGLSESLRSKRRLNLACTT